MREQGQHGAEVGAWPPRLSSFSEFGGKRSHGREGTMSPNLAIDGGGLADDVVGVVDMLFLAKNLVLSSRVYSRGEREQTVVL